MRRSRYFWGCSASALLMTVAVLAPPAGADSATIDPTWNGGAAVHLQLDTGLDIAATVAAPDGKTVLVGSTSDGSNAHGVVLRLNADGSPEASFGHDGAFVLASTSSLWDAVINDDGSIIAVGWIDAGNGSPSELMVKLDPNGSPDPSYGADGSGSAIGVAGMLLFARLGDGGSVTAAGIASRDEAGAADTGSFLITRYDAAGAPDESFGATAGETVVDTIPGTETSWEEVFGFARLTDGSYLVTGGRLIDHVEPVIMRFTPEGLLDGSFSDDGWTSLGYSTGLAESVLPDEDGSAVLSIVDDDGATHVVRMRHDGTLDSDFGAAGEIDGPGALNVIGRDSEGRILAATGGDQIELRRFSRDGMTDPGFVIQTVDVFDGGESALDGDVQPDGKVVFSVRSWNDASDAVVRIVLPSPAPPAPATGGGGGGGAGGGGDTTTTSTSTTTTTTAPRDTTQHAAATVAPSGYWLLDGGGGVHPLGDAKAFGNAAANDVVDIESTATGQGYWILRANGEVVRRGDAPVLTTRGAIAFGDRAVSLSSTPTGRGYWIFTARGGVIAAGDAPDLMSLTSTKLNAPIVDGIASPTGRGVYLVGADGGVFTRGDARFRGSTGDRHLNAPVETIVADPDGDGYWLVATDGGVFSFAAPFRGSLGGRQLNAPVTGSIGYADGYLLVAGDGGVFNFSHEPFHGSLANDPPKRPVVAIAATR